MPIGSYTAFFLPGSCAPGPLALADGRAGDPFPYAFCILFDFCLGSTVQALASTPSFLANKFTENAIKIMSADRFGLEI